MNFRDEFAQDDGGKRPIDRRNGGCGVMVGNKLYVWGGQTEDIIVWHCLCNQYQYYLK